jgi:hypothetical protein
MREARLVEKGTASIENHQSSVAHLIVASRDRWGAAQMAIAASRANDWAKPGLTATPLGCETTPNPWTPLTGGTASTLATSSVAAIPIALLPIVWFNSAVTIAIQF